MDNYNDNVNNNPNYFSGMGSNLGTSGNVNMGSTCPYLIMKICPMVANMNCPITNEMMPNSFVKSTYVKVRSVPISQLVE